MSCHRWTLRPRRDRRNGSRGGQCWFRPAAVGGGGGREWRWWGVPLGLGGVPPGLPLTSSQPALQRSVCPIEVPRYCQGPINPIHAATARPTGLIRSSCNTSVERGNPQLWTGEFFIFASNSCSPRQQQQLAIHSTAKKRKAAGFNTRRFFFVRVARLSEVQYSVPFTPDSKSPGTT